MDQLPAGWYSDQAMPGSERYWDGSQWTDQTRPVAPTPSTPPTVVPMTFPASTPSPAPQSMPTVVPTSPAMAARLDYMDGMRVPKTPGIVIAAFVLSLAGIMTCGVTGLIGLVLGIIGIGAAKRANRGFGLALTAIIIGSICALLWLVAGISMVTSNSSNSPAPAATAPALTDSPAGAVDFPPPNP